MFETSRSLPTLELPNKTGTLGTGSIAIKVIRYGNFAAKKFYRDEIGSYLSEIAILRRCQMSYIIPILGITIDTKYVYVIMPVALGDCRRLALNENQKKIFPNQLLEAIDYLSKRGIAHRDIKPQNLLILNPNTLCLCDFGMALDNPDCLTHRVATLYYRAPEMLLDDPIFTKDTYTKADIWSYGCTIFEILTGKSLFPGDSELDQLFRIFRGFGTPSGPYWEGLPEWKLNFPRWSGNDPLKVIKQYDAYDLVVKSLTLDPNRRPTASQLLNTDPWTNHRVFYPTVPGSNNRTISLNWLFELCIEWDLPRRVHPLGSYIYDSFKPTKNYQLYGCAAFAIACTHVMQKKIPEYNDWVYMADNSFTEKDLISAINEVCCAIGFEIQITTTYDLLNNPNHFTYVLMTWINNKYPPIDPRERLEELQCLVKNPKESPYAEYLRKKLKEKDLINAISARYDINIDCFSL